MNSYSARMVASAVADLEDLLKRAQDHLVAGRFSEAKASADEAFASFPDESRVREMLASLYLAHGIRLSGLAREMRRKEIETRGKPGELFEDSEAVRDVFCEVLAAFERVLAVDPGHVKAWSFKAQALFRLDRANRPAALAAYDEAVRALERTVPAGSRALEAGKRTLLRGRRQIERPCDACDDTGFCTECGGGGWRVTLGFRRKCDACLGHGICKRCGVL